VNPPPVGTTPPQERRSPHLAFAWPLPALGAWALGWVLHMQVLALGAPLWLAAAAALMAGAACSLMAPTRMRAAIVAAGFPVSLLATGTAGTLPAWVWLLPLLLLWLLYPRSAWRDAPLFPTPAGALDALPAKIALADGARILDAGCGLGHGLRALHRAYPRARIDGTEWSWPLSWAARARCRFATVWRGDMWAQDWSSYQLVYLFQRPESMPRALAKAGAEMDAGAWLASLEFEAAGAVAQDVLVCPDGRRLWLYRLPLRAAPHSSEAGPGR
jgi:hypothetical protein